MDKLTGANLEQSTVSKQLFVWGQLLLKLSISVFNGDHLQYPVSWAFNALVDSRPLDPDRGGVTAIYGLYRYVPL